MGFKCKVETAKWKVSYKLTFYFSVSTFYLQGQYYVQLVPVFCPRTQEANICHSGSFRFGHRLTPLWA